MGRAQKLKEERRSERQATADRRRRRKRLFARIAGVVAIIAVAAIAASLAMSQTKAPAATPAPATSGAPAANNQVKGRTMTIQTDKGTIQVELNPEKAPKTVEQISTLIRRGFYDGLSFHRYVPGFVIQGGDPKGDGTGGSDLPNIPFEANDLKHEKGVIAMARSQEKDSANSQFYITLEPQSSLDGNYVVFGRVTSGMDVVEQLRQGDKMTKVTIQ